VKRARVLAVLAVIAALIAVALFWVAARRLPATSSVGVSTCLEAADGACYALPRIAGQDMADTPVTLPDDLLAPATVIVLAFDDGQQLATLNWLPVLQTLTEEDPQVGYLSLAPLPDLAAPIRVLVTLPMKAAATTPAVRAATIVSFLDDQAAFLAALGIAGTDDAALLVVNRVGQVLWRGDGAYTPAAEAALRGALRELGFAVRAQDS
jgi:hypothetical protein